MPKAPPRHGKGKSPASPPEQDPPHVKSAKGYAADVRTGRIPACKWVRLACARFERDLDREMDADWPYKFSAEKAELVCKFLELLPHTKGKWAAGREMLRLEPWQCFILVNVWGFTRKSDGLRRFRDALIVVPRKAGKSALSAGIGLFMLARDGEFAAEVYSGATSEKQSWEVFRPAKLMAQGRPDLRAHYGIEVNASNIHILSNGSRFEPLIGKPGDGASPSCAIIDEYHEHADASQHDTMLTGMGAREQPLMWVITTAGDNVSGPCYDKLMSGRQILESVFDDEEKFIIEYTIDDDDDWTSLEAIRKANPNLNVSVSEEFLVSRQREAVRNTREQGRFKTKHLNLWVQSRSAYFNMQSWAACYDPTLRMEDLAGRPCKIGLDLAAKQDIAALQLVFELDDGRLATFGRYYLPEAVTNEPGMDHYRAWGLSDPPRLILTDGNMIDFERIEDDMEDIRQKFDVEEIVFDPSQATMLMTRLTNRGVSVVQFDQNTRNYSEPMKQVAALLDAGKIVHDCDGRDPMTWMMSNVTARRDAKDQVFPRKERPENKIDGPVSLIMAVSRTMVLRDTPYSDGREILVLG